MTVNFSSLDCHSVLGSVARMPLKLIPDSALVPILQGPLRGTKWIKGSFVNGCWLGSYELPEQAWCLSNVKAGMVAWDIGAHVGYYSMLLSRLVGDSGTVYAFEPYCGNANHLLKHLCVNDVRNVTVLQCAIAESGYSLAGFMPAPSADMSHIEEGNIDKYCVPSISIDALISQFGLTPPDVIKMDIEDAESLAIRGASRLIEQRKTSWVISIHSPESAKSVYSTFSQAGYGVYDLHDNTLDEDAIHSVSDLVLRPQTVEKQGDQN